MTVTGRSSAILWRILKYFGIAAAIILLLFGITSLVLFQKKEAWLLGQIQSYMDRSQSGQLEIGSLNLKLFKYFPDVTVEFDSIYYYEHRDSLRTPLEKPILHADKLHVAFELWPLLNSELKVSEISLSKAQVNIIEYQHGAFNLERALSKHPAAARKPAVKKVIKNPPSTVAAPKAKKKEPADSAEPQTTLSIDLELIHLDDIEVHWNAYKSKPSSFVVKTLDANFTVEGNTLRAEVTSTSHIQSLYINRSRLPSAELTFQTNLTYDKTSERLTVQDTEIKYDVFSATIQGTYAHQKNQTLDILIDASSNDLELLSKMVKKDILKRNPNMLTRGDIYIKGRVFGELKNKAPQFDIAFGVKNLGLNLPNKMGQFENIGFHGAFKSGRLTDYSEAVLEIRNLNGKLPDGFIKGQFHIRNFVQPYLKYKLDAKLKLDGYDRIFNIGLVKNLSGDISVQARYDGPLDFIDLSRLDSTRTSVIGLNNVSFEVARTRQLVSGLSGTIETRNNQSSFNQMAFRYGTSDLQINMRVSNLLHFIVSKEANLSASGSLKSNEIATRYFILDTLRSARVQDRIANLNLDFYVSTTGVDNQTGMPDIAFEISNLSARLDKLPDIHKLSAKGRLGDGPAGIKLVVDEFHAMMPQGKLELTGDLLIREKRMMQFNARVKVDKFPWTYVNELAAAISTDAEPHAKHLPASQMELVTADLDLSATLKSYPFDVEKLEVRNSRVNLALPDSKTFSVDKLNLSLDELRFIHPANSGALTGLKSSSGKIDMVKLKVPELAAFDIKLNVSAKEDKLDIGFSTRRLKAGVESGQLLMDLSRQEIGYQLHYTVTDASLESFVQKYRKGKLLEGRIDYVLDLNSTGATWTKVKQNIEGDIAITGDSLTLYGVDIDSFLKKYEKSQKFNLTDLGAVLIAGPIGIVATKGSDFVALGMTNLDPSQHSAIQTLYAKWKLDHRQLITEDVAIATSINRIAFDGRIDFARDSIPGFTVAVVDKNGCSLMDQKVYGKTNALKTGKLNVSRTLFGSVINFANAVVGKDCRPVYQGTVKHPTGN